RGISPEALAMLEAYPWPGNVRQLENAVFRATVLCEGDILGIEDFPQIAAQVEGYQVSIPPAPPPHAPARSEGPAVLGLDGSGTELAQIGGTGVPLGIPAVTSGGHIRRLDEVEADMIRLAMQRYRGQMSEVARKLGIGRSTLYRKIRDLGLEA